MNDNDSPVPETTPMTLAHKRQAISGALMPYLSEENLESALALWESKYASQPTFALQRFLSEFCTTATLSAQRSQILQSLIKALSGADGKPLARAGNRAGLAQPVPPVGAHQADPSVTVFARLVENLLGLLAGDLGIKTRLYLLENLATLKLPIMVQRDLRAWLSQQYVIPATTRIEEDALRQMVNLAYVALCEYLGPVKTDSLLHEAIQITERETRDAGFAVRKLL